MDDILLWLWEWFKKRKSIPNSEEIDTYLNLNYFEAGFIDSLGIYELISDIEGTHKVKFSEQNFKDRKFATISGLAEIIKELKATQEKIR